MLTVVCVQRQNFAFANIQLTELTNYSAKLTFTKYFHYHSNGNQDGKQISDMHPTT